MSRPNVTWTSNDEALLYELTERKREFQALQRAPVYNLVDNNSLDREHADVVTDGLIANADAFIDALTPFKQRR